WVALFYVVFCAAVAFPKLRPRRSWSLALIAAWIAVALVLPTVSHSGLGRNRALVCHFVAVGHGVGVLVELPDGHNLLYDSGRLGSPLAGVRPISAVLWSRGITHLD